MPAMKLNVSAVTTSQAPQSTSPARTRSVRACRRVNHSPATSSTSAAGSSQAIWPPISASNSRRSRSSPHMPPPSAAAADRAGLVAAEPAEAVVAEGELEDRVVLRAADVGAAGRRPQLDDRDPPAGRRGPSSRTRRAGGRGACPSAVCAEEQVGQASAGRTRNACSILVRNANPTRAPASASQRTGWPRRARGLDRRAAVAYAGADQQQHQQRVRVVEPEHQHRDRGERQHRAGEQAGRGRARRTPDRGVQQPDGRDAHPAPAGPGCSRRTARRAAPTAPSATATSGGLSTVIELAASEEPKKNAFHDSDPACAAAE